MKKILICLMASVLGATAARALSLQEIEYAVLHQLTESTQTSMPQLALEKQQQLAKRLPDAAYVMRNDDIEALDPAELGVALLSSVSRAMELAKEERTGVLSDGLSNEEQRAVYYALHKLLPKYNLKYVASFKEYSKAYPVKDWAAFRAAALQAQEYVYQAVIAIADQQANYRTFWLKALTH